jgi:hypothetical protein
MLEKSVESLRNTMEGNQGMIVRLASLDTRVNEVLQNLLMQRDKHIGDRGQDLSNVQNSLQALKDIVDTIFNTTQRIEYVEETLLDMQVSIEDIKKQQNKGNQ